jgi:hypothetical protein
VSHTFRIFVYILVTFIYMTMHPYANAVQFTKHTYARISRFSKRPEIMRDLSKFPKCVHIANIFCVINNLSDIGNIVGCDATVSVREKIKV